MCDLGSEVTCAPLVSRVIVAMKRSPWIGSDLRVKRGQCRTTRRLIVNMPVQKEMIGKARIV